MKKRMAVLWFAAIVASHVAMAGTNNVDIVAAARKQIGVTVGYDPAYRRLAYPNGDVPRSSGVCTDVIIRALRDARKVDLQKLVHEDMKANFAKYPQQWGLKRTDPNIDHRRVPNLQCYFKRKGWSLKATKKASDYEPGDFVTVTVGGAVGWNPICIVIPCHRVIGADGSLTGYGGRLGNKASLLAHEGG